MPSISPADSSLSSCSEISEERNFYDRSYVEDSSREDSISLSNGHHDENVAIKLNGFHQTGSLVKGDSVEIIRNVENGEEDVVFWLPPEPEDEDDDVIGSVASYDDDEDDECGDGVTWVKPSSLSGFGEEGGGSYKFKEEKLKAMNQIRNGKFMALVSQLVKSVGVDSSGENWVDIVTSLAWEAAALVKPNTHVGKAMDPDGYVKVKCIATGLRTQSQVIKGLVFKKHAAHKHMATKYKNPRVLLIYGSLDLSSDGLSSFNSMQQQEKNNLKTIVEMIENCHPNVILVEKSVSRDIQESVLAKGMTLVFDMKLHRLERVARSIGSPILAAELATGQKLRQCDSFHIERFVEEHDVSNEGVKKPSKTLMFLEGCPSRHGCTIVLMGGNSEELKRIKVVIRCAVVMAYHLMLETSFRLDQSAMLSTISIPNGFHQNGSDASSQSYKPAAFPGLSLSTSIQKVMDDSFPLFSNSEMQFSDAWKHGDCYVVSKDEIDTVLDSESILVLMSSRNASRGTVCEQSHFSHIKFYRSFDVPLGKFLHDNLLNQKLLCKACGETPEVHYFYYAHQDKQLTVQVRHLPARKSLPGETEGKLWMWGRCGQCKDGSSKSTKRVLISTAARGLSFGKFLELGFSNHSSFNSPSSCGHSFHKDFLYFFGLGPMVAMFKYSPIVTYSVSLPSDKMEFNASIKREFLKKDFDDVYLQGISMFLHIEKALKEIETRYVGVTLNIQGSSKEFSDIMLMLKHEKSQFEVDIQNAVEDESEVLSLNRIRLELLLESCIWDRRLHALLSSDLKVIETSDCPVEEIHINGQVEECLGHNSWPTCDVNNDVSTLTNNRWNDDNGLATDEFLVGLTPEDLKGWVWAPFPDIHREYMEDLQRGYLPKIESFNSYTAESTAQKLINEEGSRMHIPLGANNYIVSDYEDELSSIIACAVTILKDLSIANEDLDEDARKERGLDSSQSLIRVFSFTTSPWSSFGSSDSDSSRSTTTSSDDSNSSFDGLDLLDSSVSYSASHPEVSMGLGKFSAKRKYSVLCLYASQFRQLRDRCCPSEVDYITSLSRCRNWDAKGGKSGSFFAKTLDDRYIIKEIKKTEFDSFVKFAMNYFEYMNQCYELGNQTCLAKILGIYQVIIRATRNGKETRQDVVVMENLSFGRHIARQYDLKGALHARFTSAGNNDSGEVLLDQNFVNDMNVSPLYVGRRSKRNLQRAVYNDTNFLNSINVMDYSLLVGVDTVRHELACGIIDYLRQYTWDKQLENWVKSSLVVPKNQLPTIISPRDYKKRFRKFINTHLLSVPDHWCSQTSSNPCKLSRPSFKNEQPLHKKSQKRGNQDDDSSQKQGKRKPGT
ncbi:hypothetical protein ACS0TY_036908 [Phlomoides rotata]